MIVAAFAAGRAARPGGRGQTGRPGCPSRGPVRAGGGRRRPPGRHPGRERSDPGDEHRRDHPQGAVRKARGISNDP